jgi:short-subunit dehydrogenase
MSTQNRPLVVVTGASSRTGYELARCCAEDGFDLVIVGNESAIAEAASKLSKTGAAVESVEADLATLEGVDRLYAAIANRPVAALLANAGQGLGNAFLEEGFDHVRHVIDTNVTGTVYLIQKVGRDTGSIAAPRPARSSRSTAGRRPFWIDLRTRQAQS